MSHLCLRAIDERRGTCFSLSVPAPLFAAYLEAGEASYRDVLTQLGNLRLDEILDRERVLLDEWLIVQAHLFVELGHPPFDDLVSHFLRLALGDDTGLLDLLFLLDDLGRDVFLTDELRIGGG